jgi:hypothetical protein
MRRRRSDLPYRREARRAAALQRAMSGVPVTARALYADKLGRRGRKAAP